MEYDVILSNPMESNGIIQTNTEIQINPIASNLRDLVEGSSFSRLNFIIELHDSINDIIFAADIIFNDAGHFNEEDTESERLLVVGFTPLATLDFSSSNLGVEFIEVGFFVVGLDVDDEEGLFDLLVGFLFSLLLFSFSTELSLHFSSSVVVIIIIRTEEIFFFFFFFFLLFLSGSSSGSIARAGEFDLEFFFNNSESTNESNRIRKIVRLVRERAHVLEPTSHMRILFSVQVLVNESEQFGISVGRSKTNAVRVVEEIFVEFFEGLEDYTMKTRSLSLTHCNR